MRVTLLHPDPERGAGTVTTDVEIRPGTALVELRPALARVSGHPAWAGTAHRLAVADQLLDESHVAGQAPLVHGCVLSLGPVPCPLAEEAMRADWHVAAVAGPDCGTLLALPDRVSVTIAPGLTVRRRGDRVRARRRWRPGTERTVGATTYALRPRTPPEVPPAPSDGVRSPVATWLTPMIGSAALAVALHQPLLALVGLLGPLGAIRSVRRRRSPEVSPVPADPAALVAATIRARPDDEPVEGDVPWDDGGTVAVVGPRSLALPVARAAVLAALGTHLSGSLEVRSSRPQDWAWCVWAGTSDSVLPDSGPAVVVADDPPDPAALAHWRSAAAPAQRVVLLAASTADVPAWCRSRIEVSRASVRLHDPEGRVSHWPRHAVSESTSEAQVRRAAGLRAARTAHRDLPPTASLGAQPGIPTTDPDAVRAAWDHPRPGLVCALGGGAGGRPVTVDLVADGPHTLVAGTTGAGKSELLTGLVLALALTHPPERLSILLVDFKGGTGLGAVAGLPHVLEHVTDLDAVHANRVLTGLRAELRRRERVLVAAGVRDLAELDPSSPGTPARLLVVVDELRALTEDVPEAAAALARLAAQGRALGVHLVLATQRPAGAVGADLRANVTLRIALRVADAADSTDVLDAPDAAMIDPRTPGRALVRRGSRGLEAVQVARATTAPPVPPVRLAAAWAPGAPTWTPAQADRDLDAAPAWVSAALAAAASRPPRRLPWLPALPDVVAADEVEAGPGLAVGLADLPDEQRRAAVRWDPAAGHLLVLGGPRSGRSTTLVTVGRDALAHGWVVHAVGLPDDAIALLRIGDERGTLGTVLAVEDAVETARLLELLDAPAGPRTVLLVDRVDLVLAGLGELARGAGADRLTAVWRGSRTGTGVAATADVGAVATQHAGAFRDRLVLPVADPLLDSLAGVPASFAGSRATPGRAVHLGPVGARLVQVALPREAMRSRGVPDPSVVRVRPLPTTAPLAMHDSADVRHARRAPGAEPAAVQHELGGPRVQGQGDHAAEMQAPGAGAAPRSEPRPRGDDASPRVGYPAAGAWLVELGVGGDDAAPLGVDLRRGLLIAGPPGSGRSTALAVVGLGLDRAGHPVVRLTSGDPSVGSAPAGWLGPPAVRASGSSDGGDASGIWDGLPVLRAGTTVALPEDVTLLVDDLDELEREHPDLVGTLGVRIVATSTAQAAAAAYRGALPGLLRGRRVLVLDVHDAASAELVGPRARWLADPGRRTVGRGVLVVGRDVTPLQVYDPG